MSADLDRAVADGRVPRVQGLQLFEVYEANGALLLVTSAPSDVTLEPGEVMVRRAWSTSAEVQAARFGRDR